MRVWVHKDGVDSVATSEEKLDKLLADGWVLGKDPIKFARVKQKISSTLLSKTQEEKNQTTQKRLTTRENWTEEQRDANSRAIRQYYENLSDDAREVRSQHVKQGLANMSDEAKKQRAQKQSVVQKQVYENRSDEYKAALSKKTRLQMMNMTDEQKAARVAKIQATLKETMLAKYGVTNSFYLPSVKQKVKETCLRKYSVPYACMIPACRGASNNNSSCNRLFESFLHDSDIIYEREVHLGSYSYDFRVNNILLEIDPTPYHNSTWSPFGTPKSSSYHKDKTQVALDNGFRCIHVWDWDDVEKVIKLLLPMSRIYARKCFLKDVSVEEEKEFLTANHLQGYVKSRVALGLYYDKELVSLMTFGKPRYNNKCEWELLRFCSTYNIIGGKEKLFKYFLDNYNPQSVVSYCDLSKFTGKSYQQLGFVKQSESISKHWYNIQYNIHITDNLLRQRGFDQLFGSDYGKGVSNSYLMLQHEFVEVYDCGQATLVYTKNN